MKALFDILFVHYCFPSRLHSNGIQPDSVTGHSQTYYAKKLRKRRDFVYQRATEEAKKQVEGYKVYYDQKVR